MADSRKSRQLPRNPIELGLYHCYGSKSLLDRIEVTRKALPRQDPLSKYLHGTSQTRNSTIRATVRRPRSPLPRLSRSLRLFLLRVPRSINQPPPRQTVRWLGIPLDSKHQVVVPLWLRFHRGLESISTVKTIKTTTAITLLTATCRMAQALITELPLEVVGR